LVSCKSHLVIINKISDLNFETCIIGNESSNVVITSTYEDPVTGIRTTPERAIIISGVDIIKELSELRKLCKIQQEMIDALWDAPGMPGFKRLLAELEEINEKYATET
jgi:hypothetical protein